MTGQKIRLDLTNPETLLVASVTSAFFGSGVLLGLWLANARLG
ncbi:hypothetical protein [Pseudoxanthomonas taiwanensis]|jgi:hypothetical protein|nr:hypothetical protein [Pseudoxanthomonas taiwanensis]